MQKLNHLLLLLVIYTINSGIANAQVPLMEVNDNGTYKPSADVGLQQLNVNVKIAGAIAITTMRMTFYNKSSRLREGRLTFPLPDGVSISGFALDMNGTMRKAVPVEKAKATTVFESVERRRADPAIIEKTEGNNFRTRVYPLPVNGTRTVEITYNQELQTNKGKQYYYLPLAAKEIAQFELASSVYDQLSTPVLTEKPDGSFVFNKKGNAWTATLQKTNFTPQQALKIEIPFTPEVPQTLVQRGDDDNYFFISNVQLPAVATLKTHPKKIDIIWDNSLSGLKRDHAKEKKMLQSFFNENPNITVSLSCLANSTQCIADFEIHDSNINKLLKAIDNIIYDGATDYSQLNTLPAADAALFFTDGLCNFGEIRSLPAFPVHTIVSGSSADFSKLKYISTQTGGRLINLVSEEISVAAKQLTEQPYRFLGIKNNPQVQDVNPSHAAIVNSCFSVTGITHSLPATIILQFGHNKVEKEIPVQISTDGLTSDWPVDFFWAQQRIADKEIFYDQYKDEITQLGKQFGIVTKNTSLIVLETVQDYVRYNILPPADLRQAYDAIMKNNRGLRTADRNNLLGNAKNRVQDLKAWWNGNYPVKYKKPEMAKDDEVVVIGYGTARAQALTGSVQRRSNGEAQSDSNAPNVAGLLQGRVAGLTVESAPSTMNNIMLRGMVIDRNNSVKGKVTTVDIKSDAAYMDEMDAGMSTATGYKKYLALRENYLTTPAFYFDMANWFYKKNETARAITILSNLMELELEDASLYKTVGYVLKKYAAFDKELLITKKVLDWRPMDPQSYRDYALALQDNQQYQHALDTLYAALTQSYTDETRTRDHGIEETLVMEINNLISLHKQALNLSGIDKELIYDFPVDIRVVLNWNMDNTDIDLHVIDPSKEECYYGHRTTAMGGRLSDDFTDGFGPEQFLLKKAKPGKYKILTNFFGERQVTIAGPSTLMAEVYLKYATGKEERKTVVFQSTKDGGHNDNGNTLIAEFSF